MSERTVLRAGRREHSAMTTPAAGGSRGRGTVYVLTRAVGAERGQGEFVARTYAAQATLWR